MIYIIGLAVSAGIVGLYYFKTESAFTASRSRVIGCPVDRAVDVIKKFSTWDKWSPWLLHDKGTKLEFGGSDGDIGAYYTWNSSKVGAGKMENMAFADNRSVFQKLSFIKPFKSTSDIQWDFKALSDNRTEVTWTMKGRMPFVMRFMTKKTVAMIKKDFEFGLDLLDMYCNPDAPKYSIDFEGVTDAPSGPYIFRPYSGPVAELRNVCPKAFAELTKQTETLKLSVSEKPFVLSRKFDPKNRSIDCEISIPVDHPPENDAVNSANLPQTKAMKVLYTGPYEKLDIVWHQTLAQFKTQRHKHAKTAFPIEVYLERYEDAPEKNVTALYVPIAD